MTKEEIKWSKEYMYDLGKLIGPGLADADFYVENNMFVMRYPMQASTEAEFLKNLPDTINHLIEAFTAKYHKNQPEVLHALKVIKEFFYDK